MPLLLFALVFALQLVTSAGAQQSETQEARDARAATTYIVNTTELGGCDNPETDKINECEDGSCMGYDGDGNPVGCTLVAALAEAGGLGRGNIGFSVDGTFNVAMMGALAENVNLDGMGHDVTLISESPYFTPPILLSAVGNNSIKGVNLACTSSQGSPQGGLSLTSMGSGMQVGAPGSNGSVRISGCDTGISILGQDATTTITNTTVVGNRLGINVSGSSKNILKNNFIGVEANGQTANGNTEGIKVLSMGSNTTIEGNVISGNTNYGIQLVGKIDKELLRNVKVLGNFIGVAKDSVTAVPNGQSGLEIFGSARDVIIGEDMLGNGRANVIANNGHHGIRLMAYEDTGNGQTGSPKRVTILKNVIKNNEARGIYASESVTLPKTPILQELVMDSTGLAPDTLYGEATPGDRVDLYFTDIPPDAQGAGEGEEWIHTVFADSNGVFKTAVTDIPPAASCSDARAYTATGTDSLGSTGVFAKNYIPLGGAFNFEYSKIFLQDVSLENKLTINANWGNTPVEDRHVAVRVNENDTWRVLDGVSEEINFIMDMGSTTNGLKAIEDNEIEVRLSGCQGSTQEILRTVAVVKAPSWLETDKMEVLPKSGYVVYRRSWQIPEEPIEASVTIPNEVPYWSGLWGLDKTQFKAHFNASSLGGETMGLIEGSSAFGLGPYMHISITADGTTKLKLTPQHLGPFTGDLGLGAAGQVTFRKNICISTPFGYDVGCLKGSLTGSLELTYNAPFEYKNKVIWDYGEGTAQPTLSGNVEASVSWPVSISFGVTVDGTAVINFGPPDNLNLNGSGNITMSPYLRAFDEDYSTEIELFDFTFGGAKKQPVIFNTKQKILANADNQEGVRSAIPPSAAVSNDGTVAVAAVVSDNNNTRDVVARIKKGSKVETTLKLTEQNGRNLYPTAAFDDNGHLLVAWMHSNVTPPQTLEEVADYANSFNLAYALVDVASEKVTETGSLTDDSRADMAPKLTTGTDGSVLLTWASLSGDFGGSDEHPMSFKASLWDEGKWQTQTTVADNLANISSWDAAHLDAQTSLLIFTVDENEQGDSSMLMAANQAGGSWEPATVLADGGPVHAAAHAAYETSGEAKLIWARDSVLVAASASSPANTDTVFSIIPDDYNLLAAGELTATKGRLFFGWPGSEGPEFITDSAKTWTHPQLLSGFEKGSRAVSVTAIPSSSDSAKIYLASLDYSGDAPVTEISGQKVTVGERMATSSGYRQNELDDAIPEAHELLQNYPNPFNPATQISFKLPKSSFVKLVVYDILGREVESLVSRHMEAGNHTVRFNAHRLSSGIYLYRLTTDEFTATKQLMLLK